MNSSSKKRGNSVNAALSARMYAARKSGGSITPSLTDQRAYTRIVKGGISNVGLKMMAAPKLDAPTVAVSHRPGHGYDVRAVTKSIGGVQPVSSPLGLKATARGAHKKVALKNETLAVKEKQKAMNPGNRLPNETRKMQQARGIARHLEDVHGIYIGGGQDIPNEVPKSRSTRLAYEAGLMRVARQRGIPVLGVCGGSRRVASSYGVEEEELEKNEAATHGKRGTDKMPHGLSFPDPHSILGGARSGSKRIETVDKINSTHSKVVKTERESVILPGGTPRLAGVDTAVPTEKPLFSFGSFKPEPITTPLLSVTAIEPRKRTVEGFETTFGVPHIGVTSHPEAIAGASSAAVKASTTQGRLWSTHVMKAFKQSTQTYQRKQAVNAQIKSTVTKIK